MCTHFLQKYAESRISFCSSRVTGSYGKQFAFIFINKIKELYLKKNARYICVYIYTHFLYKYKINKLMVEKGMKIFFVCFFPHNQSCTYLLAFFFLDKKKWSDRWLVCVCVVYVHVVKRSLSNVFLVYITFYVTRCGIHAPNFLALTATVESVQLLTGIYGRTIKPQQCTSRLSTLWVSSATIHYKPEMKVIRGLSKNIIPKI